MTSLACDIGPAATIARLIASCLFAVALAACGESEPRIGSPASFARDLLRAKPFARIEEKGVLRPDPKRQWGEYSLGGWHAATGEGSGREGREVTRAPHVFLTTEVRPRPDRLAQDQSPHVFTREPRARLRLPVRRAEDRVIELLMWSPPEALAGDHAEKIDVRLNDVSLAVLEPSAAAVRHELPCPEPLWIAGDNVLELAVSGTRHAHDWRGVALAEVRYGTECVPRIDAKAGVVRLADGTGAKWAIERAAAAHIEVHGSADAEGRLEVTFTALDPRTGSIEDLPESSSLRASGGAASSFEFQGSVAVPDAGDRVALATLVWRGADGSTASLDRLLVVEQREPPPPIVFISIDTLSARHMSLYGYERETTPRLERFAADAVTFEHCVTNAPWTLPSYLSVMSGLFTPSHERGQELDRTQRKREAYDLFALADGRWSLAEMLQASGYATASFVDNVWLTESSGLQQGFEVYDASAARIPQKDVTGGIQHVLAQARAWLKTVDTADATTPPKPYFLFLHAYDVHSPYLPPKPFAGVFHGDEFYDPTLHAPSGCVSVAYGAIPNAAAPCGAHVLGTTCNHASHEVDDAEASYDEGILAMDTAVGGFLDELRARGLYDDALIVFSADHGETMHESDFYFGHGVMDESVLRVPLVVKLPRSREAGRRVEEQVQLVDLYPTLRELIGLAGERVYLHGRSLVPLIEGDELEPAPALTTSGIMRQTCVLYDGWKLVESFPELDSFLAAKLTHPLVPRDWLAEHAPEVLAGPLTADVVEGLTKRLGRAKRAELDGFIAGPRVELFCVEEDPDCRTDLSAREPERVRTLQELAARATQRALEARQSVSWNGPEPAFSDEDIAELRGLGYLESE